jgi:molybdate transport system regulatory protein
LNSRFRKPLVEVVRGGKTGGGARLTDTGRAVVVSYRKMETQSQKAVKGTWEKLQKLLQL